MRLNNQQISQNLVSFVQWVQNNIKGDEKSEAQKFQVELFKCWGIAVENLQFEERVKVQTDVKKSTKYADCLIPNTALIEMKSRGVNLIHHYNQLFNYYFRIPKEVRPQYSILCNFDEFWIFDFNQFADVPLQKITLDQLSSDSSIEALGFLIGQKARFEVNIEAITREAVDDVKELYTRLKTRQAQNKLSDEDIQRFVLQCVFCFFWEDVDSSARNFFLDILEECKKAPAFATGTIQRLFRQMDTPTPSTDLLLSNVKYFNGGLFSHVSEVPLHESDIDLMIQISRKDWRPVRPSIFGTIFEGTMDSAERHAAGAHYTSETDIRRIVNPTIVQYWDERIVEAGSSVKALEKLLTEIREYKVLDPACGSGNFLFVAYLEMKRIEQEIYDRLYAITHEHKPRIFTVSPSQFYGMDIKPFAVELAKLTLEIARQIAINQYNLHDEKPLPLQNLDSNIQCTDALFTPWIEADAIIGNPPFLGKRVIRKELGDEYVDALRQHFKDTPNNIDFCVYWFRLAQDNKAPRCGLVATNSIAQGFSRDASLKYIMDNQGAIYNAVSTMEWSGEANVHVSIANWVKRDTSSPAPPDITSPLTPLLKEKGTRKVKNAMPAEIWENLKSFAKEMRQEPTPAEDKLWQSLRNNKLVAKFRRQHPMEQFMLDFFCVEAQLAIEADGEIHADQRAYDEMRDAYLESIGIQTLRFSNEQILNNIDSVLATIKNTLSFRRGSPAGRGEVKTTYTLDDKLVPYINSSLKSEIDVTTAHRLGQNKKKSFQGCLLAGKGFIIEDEILLKKWLAGKEKEILTQILDGRSLVDPNVAYSWAIDFNDMSIEDASCYKEPFARVKELVKPERDKTKDKSANQFYWRYYRHNPAMREAFRGLSCYFAISQISKYTMFRPIDISVLPAEAVMVVASDDYYVLGVLTSRLHRDWVRAQCSTLEDRIRYTNTTCFETFPFLWRGEGTHTVDTAKADRVAEIMRELDAYRLDIMAKKQYGITKLYNEFWEEKTSRLYKLHRELDEAVLACYGWAYDPDRNYNAELFELNKAMYEGEG